MQAASPSSFDPAGAGGVLLAALLLCIGIGVLIGWAAGAAVTYALAYTFELGLSLATYFGAPR